MTVDSVKWLFIAAFFLTGGDVINATERAISVSDGWQPNEKLALVENKKNDRYGPSPYRFGTSPQGIHYKYFRDGSGSVSPREKDYSSTWSISCKTDAMSDKRQCSIMQTEVNVFIFFQQGGSRSLCVIGHDYPRRTAYVRIDKGTPIETDKDGCLGEKYLSEALKGKTIVTRHMKWPYEYYVDASGSLDGINDAVNLATFILEKGEHLKFDAH